MGPRSMLKMILDPAGGISMTNDGNAILREVDVAHPVAKSMIELARAQDEVCGDGSTAVIVLTGELISACEPLLKKMHPVILTQNLQNCQEHVIEHLKSTPLPKTAENAKILIENSVNTKFS